MCGTTTVILPKNGQNPRPVFPREIRTNLASKCTSHQLGMTVQNQSIFRHKIMYILVPSFMLKHDVASAAANPLDFASIMALIGVRSAKSSPWTRNISFVGLSAWGEYADPKSSRQNDGGVKAPIECQDEEIPLFEDEDSAAWASFSLNVAIARKSLSSVQVCIIKSFV